MKKKFFIIVSIFFILSSCNDDFKLNERESAFSFSSFKIKEDLIFKELNNIKGEARELGSFDSLLLVYEIGKEDAISIYSKNTGEFKNSDLPIGKGPNEVIGTFGYGIINDSIFWAYEGETTTIRFYHIKDILNINKAKILKKIRFELERYAYRIIPISLDSFLLTGCPSYTSKLTVLDEKGTVLDSMGKYYNLKLDDLTFLKDAYMYLLTLKPDKKYIALGYYCTDVIEIYSTDGKFINAIHGPDNYDVEPIPTEKNKSKYFSYSKKTKDAYVEIRSTDKYIFALYDGSDANKPSPNGKWIMVFDWVGNPVKLFNLSIDINNFIVDEENKMIYAQSVSTGNIVYAKFEI